MSHRQAQLESTLKRAVAEVLAQGLSDPRVSGLLSVTKLTLSPDGHEAYVHVSVLPENRGKLSIQGLRHAAGHIQSLVGKKVHIQTMPRLDFRLDDSLKKQAQVMDAIRQSQSPPADSTPAPKASTDLQPEPSANPSAKRTIDG